MSTVLNRTTRVLIVSVNTPSYPTADWIHNPDLSAVGGVDPDCWVIEGDTVRAMTPVEKDSAHLTSVKSIKSSDIDSRTSELIDAGFEYPALSGQIFSLSSEMQRNLTGLNQVRDDQVITYPIEWNYKDNSGKYSIVDSAAVKVFYLTALGTVRTHRDSGTALKDQVRGATTVAGVSAITDNR